LIKYEEETFQTGKMKSSNKWFI